MTPLPVCPECRTRLRFEPAARGQQIRCPECHANLLVALDGRVERMTNRAAEDSDGPVTQAKFDSTARRVLVASVIVLFAIGLGWALRARSRSAENSGATSSVPAPSNENEAASVASVDAPKSEIQLASAVVDPPLKKAESIGVQNLDPAPQPKLQIEQVPQLPDLEAQQPKTIALEPPPPEPREEQPPVQAAKPVVPIEVLAQQKLQRFEISKPTPLKDVLRELNELMAGRIELAEGVELKELDARVTLNLTDTTVLDVVEAALKPTALRAVVNENRMVIQKSD